MAANAASQWPAVRALHEGAPSSLELLAAAMGRPVASLRRRAEKEGWRDAGVAVSLSGQERRLRVLLDHQIGKAEAADAEDAGGGSAGKVHFDAITAAMRTLEKIGEITRDDTSAKENQTRSDADMSDALRRIDERIMELARGYAEQLAREKPDTGAG